MAGPSLTTLSSLQCPHGGKVIVVSGNPQLLASGGFVATKADSYAVVGCPFQLPFTPPVPSPCVTVQWMAADTKSSIQGKATVSESSVGVCVNAQQAPQGPLIISSPGQSKASTL